MFDIDAGKILVVGVVALLVIGPKDLPRVLRTVGNTVGRMRRMASEFQNQFMEAIKEADLEDVKKEFTAIRDSAAIDTSFDAASIMREEITAAVDGKKEIGHSTIDLTGTGPSKEAEAAATAASDWAPQELGSLAPGDSLEPPKEAQFSAADLTGTGPIADIAHAPAAEAPQELLSLAPEELPEAPEGAQSPAVASAGTAPMADAAPREAPALARAELLQAPADIGATLQQEAEAREGAQAERGAKIAVHEDESARHGGAG
jgi:sec-independent protein translocase protein TatB